MVRNPFIHKKMLSKPFGQRLHKYLKLHRIRPIYVNFAREFSLRVLSQTNSLFIFHMFYHILSALIGSISVRRYVHDLSLIHIFNPWYRDEY